MLFWITSPSGERRLRGFTAAALAALLAASFSACVSDPEPAKNAEAPPSTPSGWPLLKWPADNPYTSAKRELGRDLFFDFDLSRDRTVSCGWCHSAVTAFSDNHSTSFSTGVDGILTRRNTPTLANIGYAGILMFDGSASSLEEQALIPLLNPEEMDMTRADVETRLAADSHYVALFRKVFGEGPITLERVAQALATYQRTLISGWSPYDLWSSGDSGAISAQAKRGAGLFFSARARCATCHTPPLFTDGKFHDTGLDTVPLDSGRAGVTKLAVDIGKFKTPTLRNIALTSPFMHDGRFFNLYDVLGHYNRGGVRRAGIEIQPLGLSSEEIGDLVAFLESLSDDSRLASPWK